MAKHTIVYFTIAARKVGERSPTERQFRPNAYQQCLKEALRLAQEGFDIQCHACTGIQSIAGLGMAFMEDVFVTPHFHSMQWSRETKTYDWRKKIGGGHGGVIDFTPPNDSYKPSRYIPTEQEMMIHITRIKGETLMTDTKTTETTSPPAEEKQTIAQKVEGLQSEKTRLVGELNDMTEGKVKTDAQERINVIDRKLRWYAGRAGEAKKAATPRPTRAKVTKPAKVVQEAPVEKSEVPSSANES